MPVKRAEEFFLQINCQLEIGVLRTMVRFFKLCGIVCFSLILTFHHNQEIFIKRDLFNFHFQELVFVYFYPFWISLLKVWQIATDDLHFIICWWQWQWLCQVYSLAVMITRKPDFEPIPDPSPTQSQKHHSLLYAYGGSYKYTNIQNIIQSHCTSGIPGASAHWPLSIHPSRCSGIQTS